MVDASVSDRVGNQHLPPKVVSFGQVVTRKTLSQVKPPDQKVPAGDGMVNAKSQKWEVFHMI